MIMKSPLLFTCFVLLFAIISKAATGRKVDGNKRDADRDPCKNYGPIEFKKIETYKSELFKEMENLFAITSYLKERHFKSNICSSKTAINTEPIARKRGDYKISISIEQVKKDYKLNLEETGDIRGFISGFADFFFDGCLRRSVSYYNGRDHDSDKRRMTTHVTTNENVTWDSTVSVDITSWPGVSIENWGQDGKTDYRSFRSDRRTASSESQNHFGEFQEDKLESNGFSKQF